MRLVKLEAITTRAAEKIEQFGDTWEVQGVASRPDPYFFQSKEPHVYLVPHISRSSRNPKENLGENFRPSQTPRNLGAMWIREKNDPSFDIKAAA